MTILANIGRLMIAGAAIAAWFAILGAWLPDLDVLASFLPLFAVALAIGLLAARRRRKSFERFRPRPRVRANCAS